MLVKSESVSCQKGFEQSISASIFAENTKRMGIAT